MSNDPLKEAIETLPVGDGTLNALWICTQADRARTRAEAMEEAAQVAEAEPELEGDPPLSVMHAIQRQGPVPVLRATVAATKRNIAAAIRAKATQGGK